MVDFRAQAVRLAADGFCVFPLRDGMNTPPKGSWKARLCRTPEAAHAMWSRPEFRSANIAVHGEGLTIVDVDEGKKPGALAAYEALGLPATFSVRSPSGGYHFYFFSGVDVKNSVGLLAAGIDVRSRGGYVAAPGSVTQRGAYTVLHDLPLADAPAALVAACGAPGVARDRGDVDWDTGDTPASRIDDARNWLATDAPVSVEGAGGNATAYKVAAALHDRGVYAQDALDLMLDVWNDRCDPPWSPEEIERLVTNGYSYGQNEFGCRAPDAMFSGIVVPEAPASLFDEPAVDDDPLELICAADFQDEEIEEEEWYARGWMPARNVHLLYGDGGVGKSLASTQLAVAGATGGEWFGLKIEKPGPVVFFSAEETREEMKRRTSAALGPFSKLGVLKDLHYISRVGKDATIARFTRDEVMTPTPLWLKLRAVLAAKRPTLTILDNASDMFGGNEVSKIQVRQFMTMLRGAAEEFNTTILLLAHPSQSGMERGTSGNVAWSNSCRARLYMEYDKPVMVGKKPDEDARTITLMKANYGKRGAQLRMRWSAGRFVAEEGGDQREARELEELAALVVQVFDEKEWGGSRASLDVAKALQPLHADLALVFKQDGKYATVKGELVKRLAGGVRAAGYTVTVEGDLIVRK